MRNPLPAIDLIGVLKTTIQSALTKLQVAAGGGPESPDVVLTPAEATVVYRLLTEQLGMTIHERY